MERDVLRCLKRLAGAGWDSVFGKHGFSLRDVRSIDDLLRPLGGIDHRVPGFEDLHPAAFRAIEPGDPAKSLLYHALARPGIHPRPESAPGDYATLEELDLIENLIYSLARDRLDLNRPWVVAVFAYQYRTGSRTTHRAHADFVFSRAGVARVGNHPEEYDAAARSFAATAPDDGVPVRPARYAAFVAEWRDPDSLSLMGGPVKGDEGRRFLYPVHKLFDGAQCVPGVTLRISYAEYHRNEKLQRLHTSGRLRVPRGFDIRRPPYLRHSRNSSMVNLRRTGSSVLVAPPAAPLVRFARQRNRRSGKEEYARVQVPAERRLPFLPVPSFNRRFTTLHILGNIFKAVLDLVILMITRKPVYLLPRNAPQFLNIRHRVVTRDGEQEIEDLNEKIRDPERFDEVVSRGGYETALFEDSLCEGALVARVEGVSWPSRPAYSIVTAPDFFPAADQIEIERWTSKNVDDLKELFVNGGPEPLCKGRLSVNPAITLPGSHHRAFPPAERSVVAVVGRHAAPPKRWDPDSARTLSYLTDAATNIFAPGWDVTYAGGGKRSFYAIYGLGSPYPEDVKLCAAGAGYWAAVSPDASRTFLGEEAPTAIPILDDELGYHARHPKVASGALSESRGWDGEQGPFLEFHDGALVVNFTEIRRADYVANALAGSFRTSPLVDVDAAELIRRIDALRRCLKALPPEGDMVSSTELVLVYAEALSERELRYVFARPEKEEPVSTEDSRRMRKRVGEVYACEITPQDLSFSAVEVGPDGSA